MWCVLGVVGVVAELAVDDFGELSFQAAHGFFGTLALVDSSDRPTSRMNAARTSLGLIPDGRVLSASDSNSVDSTTVRLVSMKRPAPGSADVVGHPRWLR
jgi:hypothetical protein